MPDLSNITPVTREEEFLDRIARAAASPNLPEVDTSDNGDVLTVVSGEWAAAAPAGGLPEVTSSNNGQVLTVVSGEWAAAAPASSGGAAYAEALTMSDVPSPGALTPASVYSSLDSNDPVPVFFTVGGTKYERSAITPVNGEIEETLYAIIDDFTSDQTEITKTIVPACVNYYPAGLMTPITDDPLETDAYLTVKSGTAFVDAVDLYNQGVPYVMLMPDDLVWVRYDNK